MGQFDDLKDFATQQFEELHGDVEYPGFRIDVDLVAWQGDYWASHSGHVFRNL